MFPLVLHSPFMEESVIKYNISLKNKCLKKTISHPLLPTEKKTFYQNMTYSEIKIVK